MIYLASPYTHPDAGVRQQRFESACRAAAALICQGQTVFSPIAHSHAICNFGVPLDWRFWARRDCKDGPAAAAGRRAVRQGLVPDGDRRRTRHLATHRLPGSEGGLQAVAAVEHPVGDPRYLEQVHKCIAARRALLGLDAPTRIAPTSPDGETPYHTHVMMELMRIAEEARGGPTVIDAQRVEQQVQEVLAGQEPDHPPQLEGPTHDGR